MRPIPAELKAKIEALNQTIYANADPKMLATIIKVKSDLQVYTIATGELLGQIDLAMKWTDLTKDPEEVWIAEVINRQAAVKVYKYAKDMDFATPTRTFTLTSVGTNARVRDIAIAFDVPAEIAFDDADLIDDTNELDDAYEFDDQDEAAAFFSYLFGLPTYSLVTGEETEGSPYITWLERTTNHDTAYIIQWDGTGSQPTATKLLEVAR